MRAVHAQWVGAACFISFNLAELALSERSHGDRTALYAWFSASFFLSAFFLIGIVVAIQLELSVRRDFVAHDTLAVAKARADAASMKLFDQNSRMQELVSEKERFFSSAYHDIQQPLSTINLFIRSAKRRLEPASAAAADLEVIEKTAGDILEMFKDIQDYSELGSYHPHTAPVDVDEVLAQVAQLYAEPARCRGIRLEVARRYRAAPPVLTDRPLFKRGLQNLVSNAIKHTDQGGVVLGWVRVGDSVRVDVRDSGVGIARAHWEKIFAEYYQVDNPGRDRARGLGLGLSIVRRIAALLPEHRIGFYSREGRGSRFSLYAPISTQSPCASPDAAANAGQPNCLAGRYAVICDDEAMVLEGMRRLLESAGALVDAADSPEAVDAIIEATARSPDVFVTDIRLRDGLTGVDLAYSVRRQFAWAGNLPVVFFTGELLPPQFLGDFPAPSLLLRKSSAPERILADIEALIARANSDRPPDR